MITTQKALRATFWREYETVSRRTIPDHSGTGRMHCADTRQAFVEFVDRMQRSGAISDSLADRATLMPTPRRFEWEVQGDYGQGFECLTSAPIDRKRDAVSDLRAYRENAPGFPYRIRRVVSKG